MNKKPGLDNLANLVAGGPPGGGEKPTENDPEMQAILDFVEARGHDILGAQELLLACCMELHLQIREMEEGDE
jgi:hypothetical protein